MPFYFRHEIEKHNTNIVVRITITAKNRPKSEQFLITAKTIPIHHHILNNN